MKRLTIIFLCVVFGIGCKFSDDDTLNPAAVVCYTAIANGDTAWIKLDTSSVLMKGKMSFSYANGKKYDGNIKLRLNGDTLKGHYDFKVNKMDQWYKNPLALLKKENKLMMGVGKFSLVWGTPYFDGKTPINYDTARFVFTKTNCFN